MSVQEALPAIFAIVGSFGTIFYFVYAYFTTRHKERIELIRANKDAQIFAVHKKPGMGALRFGLLLLGAGIGMFLGMLLDTYTNIPSEVSYFSMIFISCGSMLVLFFLYAQKLNKEY